MNLFELPEVPQGQEAAETLFEGGAVRIERIVSRGASTGWYDQSESEFVTLLVGEAVIEYGDGSRTELRAGDTLTIPPHRRHRVVRTTSDPPCVWLCVFYKMQK